jgi:hypothetical protein
MIRRDFRAIDGTAATAAFPAALILTGLPLLTGP